MLVLREELKGGHPGHRQQDRAQTLSAQSKGGHVSEESRRPVAAESEEWTWLVR